MDWTSIIVTGRSGSGKSYLIARYLRGYEIEKFPQLETFDAIWICDVTGTFSIYSQWFSYFRRADGKLWKYTIFHTPREADIYKVYRVFQKVHGRKLLIIDDLTAALTRDRRKLGFFLSDARNHDISWIITVQRVKNFAPVLLQNARLAVVFPYRKLEDLREFLSSEDIKRVTKLKRHEYIVFEL